MNQKSAPGFIINEHRLLSTRGLGPAQVLVISFLLVILTATLLLMLPISSKTGEATNFINSLFTATSAVCVTGLVVVNTLAYWSLFGKFVIILCIQIGGLGFMTLVSMIFILLGKKITLKNRLIMQEALSFNTVAGTVRFTRLIVTLTLAVEAIGAVLLSFVFIPQHGLINGIGYSIFHSISAFCNAGFDMVGDSSLTPYAGNGIINFTVMSLIILGGLGYNVWVDIFHMVKRKIKGAQHYTWKQACGKMYLHTKIALLITGILLIGGFIFFFVVEYNNPQTFGMLSLKEKIYAAAFQSVSPRTAGFNTISLGAMGDASKLMTMILMFVGGSPAGTAGGIKTVTLGVLILAAISTIRGKEHTVAFKRRIPRDVVMRALTVCMLALAIVLMGIIVLTITEDANFMDIIFEAVSAFGTVGLTLGITPNLTVIGKIMIIILMFIGRLGPVTMAVALMLRQANSKGNIQYPEERILVG